jgi:extradiol dioxygenase family protein
LTTAFIVACRETAMIKGVHHNAYRCRDSEETRKFYEDCLGAAAGLCAGHQDHQDW